MTRKLKMIRTDNTYTYTHQKFSLHNNINIHTVSHFVKYCYNYYEKIIAIGQPFSGPDVFFWVRGYCRCHSKSAHPACQIVDVSVASCLGQDPTPSTFGCAKLQHYTDYVE